MADLIGRRLSFNVSYTLKVGGRLFDLRLKDYTLSLGPIWIGSSRCTEFCGILFPYSMHGLWSRRQVSAPMFMGARINLITFDVCGGIWSLPVDGKWCSDNSNPYNLLSMLLKAPCIWNISHSLIRCVSDCDISSYLRHFNLWPIVDFNSSLGLVGVRTIGRIFNQLGFHCQLLLQPVDTKWPVCHICQHGMAIHIVSRALVTL